MTAPRRIYDLLPELYRRLDADNLYALRELTEVLDVGRSQIERDINGLYRDWFVETAGRAALDRIGALVGATDISADAADHRALIADAVAYRRREGTRAAAEIRLRDLSGWPVAIGAADGDGSVTIDVWQDQACRSALVAPAPLDAGRAGPHAFRLHPLGIDIPLYQVPDRCRHMDRVFSPEYDAALPLGFEASPDAIARAVGLQFADADGAWHAIAPERIAVTALREWRASGRHSTQAAVAIDPQLGRLIVLDPALIGAPLLASFGWVPPGTIGGGSYDRSSAVRTASWIAEVDRFAVACPTAQPPVFSSLGDALAAFRRVPGCGLIRIHDSTTHDIGDTTIHDHADICRHDPDAPRRLAIEAAGGESPTIRGRLELRGAAAGLDLTLDGLWIDGTVGIEGTVALSVTHCTLRSGPATHRAERRTPAIKVGKAASGQHLAIAHSLVGPLDLARDVPLDLESCVVNGYDQRPAIAGRPVVTARRSTVIGDTDVAHLAADDTLFAGVVAIAHRGRGHIANSVVIDGPGVRWRSPSLGQPGYARLDRQTDGALFTSAGDGGEVGAFSGDRDFQRAALLQSAIPDVLPAGQRYMLAWR
ncbi:MAG: hypothetical protein E7773_07960 [Sphingomonas sp.]|uniref:hypothetical protein n=1 Tax=Sphingomonas sp. TaxID=28214 RepID=UPI001206FD76|nr:hypothetical protein [Sphingomonas sp.]THD35875.1 MAG: hypothetical protein E7773_07960 [Sphingomonas sp.]